MYSDYSFVFDIDGTLCPIKGKDEKYEDLIPYKEMIDKLRYYKENGAKIILFTSRNMNSYHGNIGVINKNTAKYYWDGWISGIYHMMRSYMENRGRGTRDFMWMTEPSDLTNL